MNTKAKTSFIALLVTLGLTVFKFLIYFVTGSLAVLSEAWHSFSDIVTTIMVLFAVRKDHPLLTDQSEKETDKKESSKRRRNLPARIRELFTTNLEIKASILIGVFLLCVSVFLVLKVIKMKEPVISRPLISGIIFVVFSFGSYFLYRFKTSVGESEKSAALIADGLHSKGDMLSALLAGFSLILYSLGIKVDRYVGAVIALFLLSFAVEILINVIAHRKAGKEEFFIEYKSFDIALMLVKKDTYHRLGHWVQKTFKLGVVTSRLVALVPKIAKLAFYVVTLGLILYYLSGSLFYVQVDSEAIIERFGVPVNKDTPIQPGLHLKFPWPIDRTVIVNTRKIRELNLGNISGEKNVPLIWGRTHGEEIHFIAGDNNFFNPYIVIHYRVNHLYDYLYRHSDPDLWLENTGYSVLTNIFKEKSFYEIAVSYRKEMERDIFISLQQECKNMKTGIEIVNVVIEDIHPPRVAASSFEEVIAALQLKEEQINMALKYEQVKLPSARANAFRKTSDANAYITEKINYSQGEASHFLSLLEEFRKNRGLASEIIYYNKIGQIMKGRNKILINPEAGVPTLWLKSTSLKTPLPIK